MSYYPSYEDQFNKLNTRQQNSLKNIPHLEKVDGWLLLVEAVELFSLANSLKSKKPVICEIGTWKGKSAYVFANALIEKHGLLYCIDPFNGDGDAASQSSYREAIKKMKKPLYQNFEETMKKYMLWDIITTFQMTSREARPLFPEKNIDILFIDGNHNYESVKTDYILWSPLIIPGGTIVFHDVAAAHTNGPLRVMEEYIFNNPAWKDHRIVGEMGMATKT